MLEWLKIVLGDQYTEEIDKQVSEEIGKGFVARADFNKLNESKKGLETQLADANKAIEGFKNLDVDGIKSAAEEWKTKAEQAERDAKNNLAKLEKEYAAKDAAGALKFSSESVKCAFLNDLFAKDLPLQEGKLLGFDDYVKAYKENDSAAFAPDKPAPEIILPLGGGGSGGDVEEARVRSIMGLPPKKA